MKILIWGGDRRQQVAARLLMQAGHQVQFRQVAGEGDVSLNMAYDWIWLPVPSFRNGILALTSTDRITPKTIRYHVDPGTRIAGYLTAEEAAILTPVYNWATDENFLEANSRLTAEAVLPFLQQDGQSVSDNPVTVLGFGRLGRALAVMLKSLGVAVEVLVRRQAVFNDIQAVGAVPGLLEKGPHHPVIINTIAAPVVQLQWLSSEMQYIELASPPYGADPELLRETGAHYIMGSGLPGRYFPVSSGRLLFMSWQHQGG